MDYSTHTSKVSVVRIRGAAFLEELGLDPSKFYVEGVKLDPGHDYYSAGFTVTVGQRSTP